MGVIDDVLARNAVFAESAAPPEGMPAPPRLHLAVVTCMDARIDVYRALGLQPGDAHVLRNAGGLVTDDVLRSLVLSQRLLGTTEVMVIQHSRCGVHGLQDTELIQQLAWETGEAPSFTFGGFADLDQSVRRSLDRIRTCPWLPAARHARGFVYDVDTARLREVE